VVNCAVTALSPKKNPVEEKDEWAPEPVLTGNGNPGRPASSLVAV